MNVVYIGDVVSGPIDRKPCWVVSAMDNLIMMIDPDGHLTGSSFNFVKTVDGKTVTGFGGAKVDIQVEDGHWSMWVNEQYVGDFATSKAGAVESAMDAADLLYGPWQRKDTEADLKRRGLL